MQNQNNKVLLALLPYWTPLIPPLGISCLKSHLTNAGFEVVTRDANMDISFREIYHKYFEIVKENVPMYKQGNFFNIGMEFMRNHMMAHINQDDIKKYHELIRILFRTTYYCEIAESSVITLIDLLEDFYVKLKVYVLDLVELVKPDIVGLSTFSGNLPASLFSFQLIKEKYPNIRTIMGGGTFSMELAVDNPNFKRLLEKAHYIDKFIVGEGEQLMLKYLKNELPPDKRVYTLADLERDETLDINNAILPDFSDLQTKLYPQLGAWTSRSCPYQCSFCSETIHWGAYKKKTPQRIAHELNEMFNLHHVQLFLFGDSLLNIVIDDLSKELTKYKNTFYWDGYLRTDPPVCKPENALRWRASGFYRARLGVESGSQKILDVMNKKITVNNIRQSVKALAGAGIKTTTYWIVGHPGETEEDFQMTLDLIEELKDDLWEAEVNPFSYFLTGQVDSDKWMSEYKRVTLYPEEFNDMLLTQTWVMQGCHPEREVIYDRVNRFVNHCHKLGIPNPYFEHEIYKADLRWKKLHPNSVPLLIDFKDNALVHEDMMSQKYDSFSVANLEDLLNT